MMFFSSQTLSNPSKIDPMGPNPNGPLSCGAIRFTRVVLGPLGGSCWRSLVSYTTEQLLPL